MTDMKDVVAIGHGGTLHNQFTDMDAQSGENGIINISPESILMKARFRVAKCLAVKTLQQSD